MARFDLTNYVDCQERINRFRAEYPEGSITTELASPPESFERVVFLARVWKQRPSTYGDVPDSTGWAAEVAGTGGANQTSWHENAETSAIGRALANMGYAKTAEDRPSRQEMDKANRETTPQPNGQARPVPTRQPDQRAFPKHAPPASWPRPIPGNPMSDAQLRRLMGPIAGKQNMGEEDVRSQVFLRYGHEHIHELTVPEASELMDLIEAGDILQGVAAR